MRLKAVRGAVCAENTKESIQKNVGALCREIFFRNNIQDQDIISVQFTVTKDLTALNPAAALRRELGCGAVPLFCAAEPDCDGALSHTIRILITWYSKSNTVVPIYMNGAEVLRPDIASI